MNFFFGGRVLVSLDAFILQPFWPISDGTDLFPIMWIFSYIVNCFLRGKESFFYDRLVIFMSLYTVFAINFLVVKALWIGKFTKFNVQSSVTYVLLQIKILKFISLCFSRPNILKIKLNDDDGAKIYLWRRHHFFFRYQHQTD